MTKTRIFALTVTAITLIAANCTILFAQAPQPASKSRTVGLTIELEKAQFVVGEKLWAILTMKNTSRQEFCLSTSPDLFRILLGIRHHRWLRINPPSIDAIGGARGTEMRQAASIFNPA